MIQKSGCCCSTIILVLFVINQRIPSGYNFLLAPDGEILSKVIFDGDLIEAHQVVTEDGYILTIHRVPGLPKSVPVLLQHGLFESSAIFLLAGKNKSLASFLSSNGFDVWISNSRGNTFSKKHTNLRIADPEFWNFSWHEVGYYDLPAVINYITDVTQMEKIHYVGHSMGATFFSVMAITRPEMQGKIRSIIGIAPAVYAYHIKGVMRLFATFQGTFSSITDTLGIHELLPRSFLFDFLAENVCTLFATSICNNVIFSIVGFNHINLNATLVPDILKILPAGTSVRLMKHFIQQMSVDEFRYFDYGRAMNLQIYKRDSPPNYDLRRIDVPVAVFYGENDFLSNYEDALKFYNAVPNKMGFFKVMDKDFNHFDFLWGLNAPDLVYSKITALFFAH